VMGHTLDGRIGQVTTDLEARLPFSVQPVVPVEINSNDRIDVPVVVANNTSDDREVTLRVAANGLSLREGQTDANFPVPAQGRARQPFRFQPDAPDGSAVLQLEGETKPFAADSMRRTFTVVPEGFPVVSSKSDMLEKALRQEVVLPETWVKGTLKLQADVYP